MRPAARVGFVVVVGLCVGFLALGAAAVLADRSLDQAQRLWALAGLVLLAGVVAGSAAMFVLGERQTYEQQERDRERGIR